MYAAENELFQRGGWIDAGDGAVVVPVAMFQCRSHDERSTAPSPADAPKDHAHRHAKLAHGVVSILFGTLVGDARRARSRRRTGRPFSMTSASSSSSTSRYRWICRSATKTAAGSPRRLLRTSGRVILALVYFQCPMLCTMVLNDLTRALNSLDPHRRDRFDVVAVSFDPVKPRSWRPQRRRRICSATADPTRPTAGTSSPVRPIRSHRLTDAVGFPYVWDAQNQVFAHASGIIVLTPQGKISRYFFGIDYEPVDLRLSLVEAAGEKVAVARRSGPPLLLPLRPAHRAIRAC